MINWKIETMPFIISKILTFVKKRATILNEILKKRYSVCQSELLYYKKYVKMKVALSI